MPLVRKAQARDYKRHIEDYVLPKLGSVRLDCLTPRDLVGLQAELLAQPLKRHARKRLPENQRDAEKQRRKAGDPRTLSIKYVRNILLASLRAMLRDATFIDEIPVRSNLFRGLQWPRGIVPGPEPYEPEQRDRILAVPREAFRIALRKTGSDRAQAPASAVLRILAYTLLDGHAAFGSCGAPLGRC